MRGAERPPSQRRIKFTLAGYLADIHIWVRASRDEPEAGSDRTSSSDQPVSPGKEPTMLVLSRQRDETIMIGDDVEITVVDIRGEKVRLGINAPAHIAVHRKEVYDAIKREKLAAARGTGEEVHVESLANRKKRPEPPPKSDQ